MVKQEIYFSFNECIETFAPNSVKTKKKFQSILHVKIKQNVYR